MISRARSARRKKWIWDIFWMSGHACFADPDTPPPTLVSPGRTNIIYKRNLYWPAITVLGAQVVGPGAWVVGQLILAHWGGL